MEEKLDFRLTQHFITNIDSEIAKLLTDELYRQDNNLELIASENYPSMAVRAACASIAIAKYSEGYPSKRYYGGCEIIDKIENLAIKRACKLFKVKYANVQPHSGSQANAAAYRAFEIALQKSGKLKPNEQMRILATQLNDGGHLTHGSAVSFSSHQYHFDFFPLDDSGHINFEIIEKEIIKTKPHVLLAGWSAYPYKVDFKQFKDLVKKYDIKLMVDMAHIAGLVAAGMHSNPCKYADIVTTTTHKTLRGPRGGIILTNDEELIKYVNSAVFPYYQGGPLQNIIAAKAICFKEALSSTFKLYCKKLINNMKAFSKVFVDNGCVCSGLSENHLMLLNTKASYGLTGKEAQDMLELVGITVNKNMLPKDDEKPNITSGIRVGLAAITTRNCTTLNAAVIAQTINDYLRGKLNVEQAKIKVKAIIVDLTPVDAI